MAASSIAEMHHHLLAPGGPIKGGKAPRHRLEVRTGAAPYWPIRSRIGEEYQAVVEEYATPSASDSMERREQTVFDPTRLAPESVAAYLSRAYDIWPTARVTPISNRSRSAGGTSGLSGEAEEEALAVLASHEYNTESALEMLANTAPPSVLALTAREALEFDSIICSQGKNFKAIRAKIPRHTLGELVGYYYARKHLPRASTEPPLFLRAKPVITYSLRRGSAVPPPKVSPALQDVVPTGTIVPAMALDDVASRDTSPSPFERGEENSSCTILPSNAGHVEIPSNAVNDDDKSGRSTPSIKTGEKLEESVAPVIADMNSADASSIKSNEQSMCDAEACDQHVKLEGSVKVEEKSTNVQSTSSFHSTDAINDETIDEIPTPSEDILKRAASDRTAPTRLQIKSDVSDEALAQPAEDGMRVASDLHLYDEVAGMVSDEAPNRSEDTTGETYDEALREHVETITSDTLSDHVVRVTEQESVDETCLSDVAIPMEVEPNSAKG